MVHDGFYHNFYHGFIMIKLCRCEGYSSMNQQQLGYNKNPFEQRGFKDQQRKGFYTNYTTEMGVIFLAKNGDVQSLTNTNATGI